MVLSLYLSLLSSSCRSLYVFAKINFIYFEMVPVDLMKAEHCSEDFTQLNPLRKVPFMKDEDFILGESEAIMLYLSRRFRTPDFWYPADPQLCALVDEYLGWQHLNLKKHCAKVLWMKLVIPHFFKATVSGEKLKKAMEELSHSLDFLRRKFLQNKLFLTGNTISLADLMAMEDVVQVTSAGCDILETHPWLKVWLNRVESYVTQELCDEVREPILKLKDEPSLNPEVMRKFDLEKEELLS